jgi:hypothetical protein
MSIVGSVDAAAGDAATPRDLSEGADCPGGSEDLAAGLSGDEFHFDEQPRLGVPSAESATPPHPASSSSADSLEAQPWNTAAAPQAAAPPVHGGVQTLSVEIMQMMLREATEHPASFLAATQVNRYWRDVAKAHPVLERLTEDSERRLESRKRHLATTNQPGLSIRTADPSS